MRKFNVKRAFIAVLLVVPVMFLSACSSSDDSSADFSGEDINTPDSPLTTNAVSSENLTLYEDCIGKTFSAIEDQFGKLTYEYDWNGGSYYSAESTSTMFVFGAYDASDTSECTAVSDSLSALVPDLCANADSEGILSFDEISGYFESTYEYSYDYNEDMCYVGTAERKSPLTQKSYIFFLYPESDGSCSVDSFAIVRNADI